MILLSNAGDNMQSSPRASDEVLVGTVDGVALLRRTEGRWDVAHRALRGCFVSAVTRSPEGSLFAATHGVGVARSRDGGLTWEWCNHGIHDHDLWAARGGVLMGSNVVCVGSLPANVYLSEDEGDTWRRLDAVRAVDSVSQWTFPPPPHVGHVKEIVLNGDRLLVGVEIGALLVSDDFGETFRELPVEPEAVERDIHRVLVHPERPGRIIVANGIVGVASSEDDGATWQRHALMPGANYPDAFVLNPDNPDELFLAAGNGWPQHWYRLGRARGRIVRSRDAGKTWTRLLSGLPDGQRALFSALSAHATPQGLFLYTADTDGQIFESRDAGESWSVIADVAPVSKGEFHRALVKDRQKLSNIDEVKFGVTASGRFETFGVD